MFDPIYIVWLLLYNLMKESLKDNRIKIVKSHPQGAGGGSTQIVIPKEFCQRYGFGRYDTLILIPEEDYFKVMKLRLIIPGESRQ